LEPKGQTRISLRDRKKLKTRISVQQQAMRLFQKQGYNETTVEQIAEAAEISPSTFFRYFPTKESVVLTDFYDPLILELMAAQPKDLSPLEALRRTLREIFENMLAEERESEMERSRLIMSVPELRTAAMDNLISTFQQMTTALAKRAGRQPDDAEIRMFAGAFFGITLSVGLIWMEDTTRDLLQLFDSAMGYMEKGLPLTTQE
jgi:AcrR family transcriptional regulator